MKKIIFSTALLCSSTLWAGFNFGECSGSGTFAQHIDAYGGDTESAVTVGTIPKGIQGLEVNLTSNADVDIRLYGANNDKVVHWPNGILKKGSKETKPYKGVDVTYSGYNGIQGEKGNEFIKVAGSTPTDLTMKAFGYREGDATVKYSWTGKDGCSPDAGTGHFTQDIPKKDIALVGEIPAEIENLKVSLKSDKDIDIQLYGADGTAIIAWPNGLLSGARKDSITYNGMTIEWSGYNGVNDQHGHEYIKLTGKTTEKITMKVYGYQAGKADVDYSWGENNNTNPCITIEQLVDKLGHSEDVTKVNTSCITDMRYLFKDMTSFNQDISGWDVSNVTNMEEMFAHAESFNQDISGWDVSKVTNMTAMFLNAQSFNQNIGKWNVSYVNNMEGMFAYTHLFNQNIGKWDVSHVSNMKGMFSLAKSFNQNIGKWDVSHVNNMEGMFAQAESFNQDISKWDVSNVTNMEGMFFSTQLFNQDIANWNVSNVTNHTYFADKSVLDSKYNPFNNIKPTVVSISDITSYEGKYFIHKVVLSEITTVDTEYVYNVIEGSAKEVHMSMHGDFNGVPKFTNPNIVFNQENSIITVPPGIKNFDIKIEVLADGANTGDAPYETYTIVLGKKSAKGTIIDITP